MCFHHAVPFASHLLPHHIPLPLREDCRLALGLIRQQRVIRLLHRLGRGFIHELRFGIGWLDGWTIAAGALWSIPLGSERGPVR